MGSLISQALDPAVMTMFFAGIAAIATVLTLAMPYLVTDTLDKRMRAVALEREKIRQRERERLALGSKAMLRQSPKQYMKKVVDNFNLSKWVGQEEARAKLVQAGYRGQAPYITYLFFRMTMPIAMLLVSLFYIFIVLELDYPPMIKFAMSIGCAYMGMQSPNLFLKNKIQRRQLSLKRAFPDALDLSADLRGIRHVDRSGIPQGQRGGRHPIGGAGRGTHADHGGIVLSAGSPPGL